jgi:hypothetical protein
VRLRRRGGVRGVVEGVYFAEGAKATLQIVDDGPRCEGFVAGGAEAGPPVNVMVDGRFLVLRVGEV